MWVGFPSKHEGRRFLLLVAQWSRDGVQNGEPHVAERSIAQDVVRGKTDSTPEVSR